MIHFGGRPGLRIRALGLPRAPRLRLRLGLGLGARPRVRVRSGSESIQGLLLQRCRVAAAAAWFLQIQGPYIPISAVSYY